MKGLECSQIQKSILVKDSGKERLSDEKKAAASSVEGEKLDYLLSLIGFDFSRTRTKKNRFSSYVQSLVGGRKCFELIRRTSKLSKNFGFQKSENIVILSTKNTPNQGVLQIQQL